jgi:hypothetical protein
MYTEKFSSLRIDKKSLKDTTSEIGIGCEAIPGRLDA